MEFESDYERPDTLHQESRITGRCLRIGTFILLEAMVVGLLIYPRRNLSWLLEDA